MVENHLSEMRRAPGGEFVAPLAATGAITGATTVTTSAVSWPAIFAGAAGSAALSLILLILGTGLGLSSISPWAGQGASAETLGLSAILWLTLTQLAAAGMGGYLTGRLRTQWAHTHTDEVYFRDTAHGFLSWALATLVTAAFLASAIGSIVSGGVRAGAAVAAGAAEATGAAVSATVGAGMVGAAKADSASEGQGYFLDALFRKAENATADATSSATPTGSPMNSMSATAMSPMDGRSRVAEAGRILASAMTTGTLAADDAKYLGQMVAQRTGLTQEEAQKRVTDTFARMQAKAKEVETAARDAADKARKASAYSALWLFVSLLIGAFCASLAATFGGRQRDRV